MACELATAPVIMFVNVLLAPGRRLDNSRLVAGACSTDVIAPVGTSSTEHADDDDDDDCGCFGSESFNGSMSL